MELRNQIAAAGGLDLVVNVARAAGVDAGLHRAEEILAVRGGSPLMNPVKIRIGQSTTQVIYAGMTGAGLYQFNTVVPNLPDGDYPVVAEVAGVRTASIARLRIQR